MRGKILKQVAVVFDGKARAWIQPLVDFGVPVGKAKSTGAVVVVGRDVDPSRRRNCSRDGHPKQSVIYAVGMLIRKNPEHRGGHSAQICLFLKDREVHRW